MRNLHKKPNRWLFFCAAAILICLCLRVSAQSQQVSGTVTDEKGVGLTGVTIRIKNKSVGTSSDKSGNYSISVNQGDILSFSFLGYLTQEISYSNQLKLNVSLVSEESKLNDIVVTGVFDKRTALSSSIAITSISSAAISKQVPLSAADLLRNVPGIYVSSAVGEIRNSVYSRGVSGTSDGGAGYYYVSLQEDGLPVTNITFGNWGPDYFLRPDVTLGKLEAVRGGTASILGNNSPGGIFNYISKTGGAKFGAEFRAKSGLEGNGNNPFYRGDLNFGGPISKDGSVTYNIGGFYRYAIGAKDPGYAFNRGGQVKANVEKKYATGSIKIYGKYLNDRNGFYENTPTTLDFDPAPGFKSTSTVSPAAFNSPYVFQGEENLFNPKNLIHSKDRSIGASWVQRLGEGWTFNNSIRYSNKSTVWNTTTLVSPLAMDNLITYAALGLLGRAGTYTFTDAVTGNKLGNVTSASGFDFSAANSNYPGSNIQANSLLIQPFFVNRNSAHEFINQGSLTKTLKDMSFSLGALYSRTKVNAFSGTAGFGLGTIQDRPHPVSATLTNSAGQVYQLTNNANVFQQGGSGFTENQGTQNQLAVFFGHNWRIVKKLSLDYGVRYESVKVDGFAGTSVANPSSRNPSFGGIDNNPLTVFDNYGGAAGAQYGFDKRVNTFSYSAGLNYEVASNMSVYARYSSGKKAPDLSIYFAANTPFTSANLLAVPQKINQAEIGLKLSNNVFGLFITPFYSKISNIPRVQLFVNADNTTNYNPPVQYNTNRTYGVELESKTEFNKNFSLRAVATFQSVKSLVNTLWVPNANGPSDDILVDYSGAKLAGTPNVIVNVTPTYTLNKFYTNISWQYLGRRIEGNNVFSLPGYSLFNFSAGYELNKRIQIGLNINNLTNTYGIGTFSRPGDFFTLLTGADYTKVQYDADKAANRIASAVGIQPRAYYFTFTYKL